MFSARCALLLSSLAHQYGLRLNPFEQIFQIGALPIVVLGPLGAVSLLWNAFFAKFILGDDFTANMAAGIALISGGAVLIGVFGGKFRSVYCTHQPQAEAVFSL